MARIPTYESQVGLQVPPSNMPFASLDALSAPGEAATKMGAAVDKAGEVLGEIGAKKQQVIATDQAYSEVYNLTADLAKAGQTATNVDDYKKYVEERVAAGATKMTSDQGRMAFGYHASHFADQALLNVQHRLFTQNLQDQKGVLMDDLAKQALQVNSAQDVGQMSELEDLAAARIAEGVKNRFITAPEGERLKKQYTEMRWDGYLRQRIYDSPGATVQELETGVWDGVINPMMKSALLEHAAGGVRRIDREIKVQQHEDERAAAFQQKSIYQSLSNAYLNNQFQTPAAALQAVESSGLTDLGFINTFTRNVQSNVKSEMGKALSPILAMAKLPTDLGERLAKKANLSDVTAIQIQEYNKIARRMEGLVWNTENPALAMTVQQAQDVILNEMKTTAAAGVLTEDHYPVPEGFSGDAFSVESLNKFWESSRSLFDKQQMSYGAFSTINSQINARLNWLNKHPEKQSRIPVTYR